VINTLNLFSNTISRATVIQIISPHSPASFPLLYISINLKVKWYYIIFVRYLWNRQESLFLLDKKIFYQQAGPTGGTPVPRNMFSTKSVIARTYASSRKSGIAELKYEW